eukprot:758857-Hanusia_phi.AAC.1
MILQQRNGPDGPGAGPQIGPGKSGSECRRRLGKGLSFAGPAAGVRPSRDDPTSPALVSCGTLSQDRVTVLLLQ